MWCCFCSRRVHWNKRQREEAEVCCYFRSRTKAAQRFRSGRDAECDSICPHAISSLLVLGGSGLLRDLCRAIVLLAALYRQQRIKDSIPKQSGRSLAASHADQKFCEWHRALARQSDLRLQ